MSYPCFVHGEETGPSCLCEHCESDVHNGKWCPKHHIFHWYDKPCPVCAILGVCNNSNLSDKKTLIIQLCAEK